MNFSRGLISDMLTVDKERRHGSWVGCAALSGALAFGVVCAIFLLSRQTGLIAAAAEMKDTSSAIWIFTESHGGRLPNLRDRFLLARQIGGRGVKSPLWRWNPMLERPDNHVPYVGNSSLSGKKLDTIPDGTIVLYESSSTGGGREVVILQRGGEAATLRSGYITDAEWKSRAQASGI